MMREIARDCTIQCGFPWQLPGSVHTGTCLAVNAKSGATWFPAACLLLDRYAQQQERPAGALAGRAYGCVPLRAHSDAISTSAGPKTMAHHNLVAVLFTAVLAYFAAVIAATNNQG